jgi:hypothetical protein
MRQASEASVVEGFGGLAPKAERSEDLSVKVWAAILIPLWAWFALCAHWEPVVFDSWGHFLWHRDVGLSLTHVHEFVVDSYTHWNPRLGELATLLSFTPGPWHVLVTPVMELAMFYLVTAAVLGRWPRTSDDALVFAMVTALVLVCAVDPGTVLFYRPFAWNFAFALATAAAFVLPYRMAGDDARWWWLPAMAWLGLVTGLGAEHTGPAVAGIAIVCMVARRPRAWMVTGVLALLAGWLVLVLAPAQHYKYGGLAAKESMLDIITSRGAGGNVHILWVPLLALWPALAWVAIAVAARVRGARPAWPRALTVALIAAAVVLLTLLPSPKQWPRLYLAPTAMVCAAIAAGVALHLTTRWARIAAAALTAVVLVIAGAHCLVTYHTLGSEFAARWALLEPARPGTRVNVPRFSIGRTHWTLRDDLAEADRRTLLATQLGLAAVDLAP